MAANVDSHFCAINFIVIPNKCFWWNSFPFDQKAFKGKEWSKRTKSWKKKIMLFAITSFLRCYSKRLLLYEFLLVWIPLTEYYLVVKPIKKTDINFYLLPVEPRGCQSNQNYQSSLINSHHQIIQFYQSPKTVSYMRFVKPLKLETTYTMLGYLDKTIWSSFYLHVV